MVASPKPRKGLYEFLRERHLQDLVSLRRIEREFISATLRHAIRELRKRIQQSLVELRRARKNIQ